MGWDSAQELGAETILGKREAILDPIEKAIRGALAKGNIEDAAFRRRIYASAEQALIRSLEAKGGKTPAEQQARVKHLRAMAANIETEFEPAAPAVQAPQRPQRSPIVVWSLNRLLSPGIMKIHRPSGNRGRNCSTGWLDCSCS